MKRSGFFIVSVVLVVLSLTIAPLHTVSAQGNALSIVITNNPPFGLNGNNPLPANCNEPVTDPYALTGQVNNLPPGASYDNYFVAVYIFVPDYLQYQGENGWWIKPTRDCAITSIQPDGSWIADITTGGVDEYATHIMAFLFPRSFVPIFLTCCRLLGAPELPPILWENAISFDEVIRPYMAKRIKFTSIADMDGWILESGENTNTGGRADSISSVLRLGDNNVRKQYRSIVSFRTSPLPDTAVILKASLRLKHISAIPSAPDPIFGFQGIILDLRKGFFDTSSSLQLNDFNAAPTLRDGPFVPNLVDGWYTIDLKQEKLAFIHTSIEGEGLTQIRVRFRLDDNGNNLAEVLNLASGNHPNAAFRPVLLLTYYVP